MKKLPGNVIAAIILLIVFSALGTWLVIAYNRSLKVAAVGDLAPDIQTPTVTFQSFDLNSLRGEPVFLNYFTPWCVPCQQETPDIIQFAKQYGNRIHLVMIDRGDPVNMIRDYINKYHLPADITVLQDPNNDWSQPFGVTGQPETFFIRSNGIIASHLIGPLTEAQMIQYAKAAGMSTNTEVKKP